MKATLLTTLAILLITAIFAQAPEAFKYQAVIRNNQGKVLVNQIVSLRISILQDNPLGDVVYMETHQIATTEYGIANLSIGQGTVVTGIFANINWGATTHFVKTELDITGNQNYEFIGTSQLLSVPYAMFAKYAGNASDDFDKDSLNEIQQLSLIDNQLTISKGNTIILPPDNDADTLNEIQNLSLNGNELTISKGNTITFTGAVDLDADPTNELQFLSISNDTIFLSNGNFVKLPQHMDNDSLNEIQTLNQNSNIVTLSKNGGQININDADSSSTNEIQQLSFINDTLSLSNSNYFYISQSFNFALPDGPKIDSVIFISNANLTPFVVPNGYTFYLTNSNSSNIYINDLVFLTKNYNIFNTHNFLNPIIIPSGIKVSTEQGNYLSGLLFKKKFEPIFLIDLYTNPYTVPTDKILVITNVKLMEGSTDCQPYSDDSVLVNGVEIIMNSHLYNPSSNSLKNPQFIKGGSIVSTKVHSCVSNINERKSIISGYLINKN